MKKQSFRVMSILLATMIVALSIPFSSFSALTPTFATELEGVNYYGTYEYGLYDGTDFSVSSDENAAALTNEKAYEGSYSLKIPADAAREYNSFTANKVYLEKDKTYTFMAEVYVADKNLSTVLKLEVTDCTTWDAVGTTVELAPATVGYGKWVTVRRQFTAASTGDHKLIIGGIKKGDVVYLDSFRIYEDFSIANEAEGVNLFGTYEYGIYAGTDFSVWADAYAAVLSDEKAYEGSYSLKMPADATNDWNGFTANNVDLKANTKYKVTAQVFVEGKDLSSNLKLEIQDRVVWSNIGSAKEIAPATVGHDAWYKVEREFTTNNEGSHKISIGGIKKGDVVYIDNFCIEEVAETLTEIDLVNKYGTYEYGIYKTTDLIVGSDADGAVLSDEKAYEGSYSLKVPADTNNDYNGFTANKVNLEANKTYVYSAKIYVANKKLTTNLKLDAQDRTTWQSLGTPLEIDPSTIGYGDWVTVRRVFTTVSTGEHKLMIGQIKKGDVVYIDNFTIEEYVPTEIDLVNKYGTYEYGIYSESDLSVWADANAAVLSDEQAYEGHYSLKVPVDTNNDHNAFTANKVDLEANKTYVFSAMIYVADNNLTENLKLEAQDRTTWSKLGTTSEISPSTIGHGEWVSVSKVFTTVTKGEHKLLIGSIAKGDVVYLDNFRIDEYVASDMESKTYLTDFDVAQTETADINNLIVDGDLETAGSNSIWNKNTFIKNGVLTLVNDKNLAASGNNVLHFAPNGTTREVVYFPVTVKANTEYMLSFKVKGSYFGANNKADMSFGVMNSDTMEYLMLQEMRNGYYDESPNNTATKAMTPPSWDNQWHSRGCKFYTGDATVVYIAVSGNCSDAYLDDIKLCEASNAIKAQNEVLTDVSIKNFEVSLKWCEDEDNIVDFSDFSSDEDGYWSNGMGYKRMISPFTLTTASGDNSTVLASSQLLRRPTNSFYIKWIDVKPNTDYTVTVKGFSSLENEEGNPIFGIVNSNPYFINGTIGWTLEAKNEWQFMSADINTGDYSKIGFYVCDAGGDTMISDLRIFETGKGTEIPTSELTTPGGIAEGSYDINIGADNNDNDNVNDSNTNNSNDNVTNNGNTGNDSSVDDNATDDDYVDDDEDIYDDENESEDEDDNESKKETVIKKVKRYKTIPGSEFPYLIVIIIAIVVVLAVAGITLFIILKKKRNNKS